MHKKDVRNADQATFNAMALMRYASNAFIVCIAIEPIFGKLNTIALLGGSIGLNCG